MSPDSTALAGAKPKLLDRLRAACRLRHYSLRTEDAYAAWVVRFIRFHRLRHPLEMGADAINAFLTHLAVATPAAERCTGTTPTRRRSPGRSPWPCARRA